MRYSGRGYVVIFLFLTVLATSLSYYSRSSMAITFQLSLLFVLSITSWRLGKKYDQMTFYAQYDPLTMVYNRHFVNSLFLHKQKHHSHFRVLIIDIDHFKSINDTYGHREGDMVLKNVASSLTKAIRKSDPVIRWGGDEFLLLLPCSTTNCNDDHIINRLAHTIRESSQPLPHPIHISIGAACYPDDGHDLHQLITIADARMYHQKQQKREKNQRV